MDIKIETLKENYLLKISYKVNLPIYDTWKYIATTDGFSKWFKELHIEEVDIIEKLVFKMDGFREEMDILEKIENKIISYKWDSAFVKFFLESINKSTIISFEELIPKNFGNEYSNAKKDMAGWCVQNERLFSIIENKNCLDIKVLQEKWENFIENKLNIHLEN